MFLLEMRYFRRVQRPSRPPNARVLSTGSIRNAVPEANAMKDWIDYYDFDAHDLCEQAASRRAFPDRGRGHHRLHPSRRRRGAGLCLRRSAVRAEGCGCLRASLILAEPAPGVRGRLIDRFAPITKIKVRSLDDLRNMDAGSVDLAVMNSVAQYMTPQELDIAFAVVGRLLKPDGRLVIGDILQPGVGSLSDVTSLLRLARASTDS